MIPLLMPKQAPDSQARVLTHLAKNCDMFGEDVKIDPLRSDAAPDMPVGMDANHAVPSPTGIDDQSRAQCFSCTNFIPPKVVNEKTGWIGGICKATGNLIVDNRQAYYSRTCGKYVRKVGVRNLDPWGTFTLFPHFSDSFGVVDARASYEAGIREFIDPRVYPTDRPVSDRMKARGIRAWRRIVDPTGYGDPVFLPIFDESIFTDEERAHIPRTEDKERPQLYADHSGNEYTIAVLWMKLDETPAMWGAGGTGKTEFARYLAWRMCLPYRRIAISGASETDDIIGKILFEDGATTIHYGRLPKSWMSRCILLIDEPNTGPPEIWQQFRSMFDNSRSIVLDALKHERIDRHEDCYPCLAMNPSWHPLNVGTQMVGDADLSRLMHMYFDYPPRPLEEEILRQRAKLDGWEIPSDTMNSVMQVCKNLREQVDSGILHTTWGVRHQIKVARALRWFPPVKAYRLAVADCLEPQQLEAVLTEVKSFFKE